MEERKGKIQQVADAQYLSFALRVVLGGILITVAMGKLSYPVPPAAQAEIMGIYAFVFPWIPNGVVTAYMSALPWLETILGGCLMLGLFPRICGGVCTPIILSFISANSALSVTAIEAHQRCPECFGTLFMLS